MLTVPICFNVYCKLGTVIFLKTPQTKGGWGPGKDNLGRPPGNSLTAWWLLREWGVEQVV